MAGREDAHGVATIEAILGASSSGSAFCASRLGAVRLAEAALQGAATAYNSVAQAALAGALALRKVLGVAIAVAGAAAVAADGVAEWFLDVMVTAMHGLV